MEASGYSRHVLMVLSRELVIMRPSHTVTARTCRELADVMLSRDLVHGEGSSSCVVPSTREHENSPLAARQQGDARRHRVLSADISASFPRPASCQSAGWAPTGRVEVRHTASTQVSGNVVSKQGIVTLCKQLTCRFCKHLKPLDSASLAVTNFRRLQPKQRKNDASSLPQCNLDPRSVRSQ